jgi:hypothetical protein
MARKPFAVNDAMRQKVRHLAGLGIPQDDIAKIIGCAPKTLRKQLRDELDLGAAEANATIADNLFAAAKAGNITAMIFWLKTRARWREGGVPERLAPEADAGSNSQTVVILPDNGRDPELAEALRKAQEEYFARKRRPP